MKIQTRTFGTIEIDEERIIHFVEALPGLEGVAKYALLDSNPASPFKVLQVTDDPERSFLVADAKALFPDYRVEPDAGELADLELQDPERAVVMAIVNLHREPRRLTANLKAPIFVNAEKFLAKQIVLRDGDYCVDEPIEIGEVQA